MDHKPDIQAVSMLCLLNEKTHRFFFGQFCHLAHTSTTENGTFEKISPKVDESGNAGMNYYGEIVSQLFENAGQIVSMGRRIPHKNAKSFF